MRFLGRSPKPTELLAQVRRDPDAPKHLAAVDEILSTIARRRPPRATDLSLLVEHAQLLAVLGRAERARALLRGLRQAGLDAPRADVADAVLTLSIDPKGASARLRALATEDPALAAYETVRCFLRGDVVAACDHLLRHGGFVDAPDATDALAYGLVALALCLRFDDAHEILSAWRARNARPPPEREVGILRAEAMLASYENRYADALSALEEALALCREHGLGDVRVYIEVNLAILLARSGDLAGARRAIARFPEGSHAPTEVDAYRDLARIELALFDEDHRTAERFARRALAVAEESGKIVVQSLLRFVLALAAPSRRAHLALGDYARIVHRHRIPHHVARLRVLERLGPLHATRLVLRSGRGAERVPLFRAWHPSSAALAADLYVDQVHGTLHVRGHRPVPLDESPVRARMLEAILDAPGFTIALPDLFERVWEMPYAPLRHEGKCHVTLHRLRTSLAERGAAGLLELANGAVRVASRAEVCILSVEGAARDAPAVASLEERVREALLGGELPPRALAQTLGVSRSALQGALRALASEGAVRRLGRGRSTRYGLA